MFLLSNSLFSVSFTFPAKLLEAAFEWYEDDPFESLTLDKEAEGKRGKRGYTSMWEVGFGRSGGMGVGVLFLDQNPLLTRTTHVIAVLNRRRWLRVF